MDIDAAGATGGMAREHTSGARAGVCDAEFDGLISKRRGTADGHELRNERSHPVGGVLKREEAEGRSSEDTLDWRQYPTETTIQHSRASQALRP